MTLVPIVLLSRADRCGLGNNIRRERPRPVTRPVALATTRSGRAMRSPAPARRIVVVPPCERRTQ
jgi:hypothetical protein